METNQSNVLISDDGEGTELERFDDDVRPKRYAEAADSPTWRARRNRPGTAP
jgi:hypothetical protein